MPPMKFRLLLGFVTPHRRTLLLIVVLLVASSAVTLTNPWIAGQLTRTVLEPGDAGLGLDAILLIWAGLLLARAALALASHYVTGVTGEQMSVALRDRVYEHMQVLPLGYYQDRKPGELLSLLANDSQIISGFVTGTLVRLLPQLFVFFGALGMMALIDLQVTAIAAVLMPVYFLAMKLIGRRIRPVTHRWISAWSDMYAHAQENVALIPAVKAFGRETTERLRFRERNREVLALSKRQIRLQAMLSPAVNLLSGIGLLFLLWLGLRRVDAGLLDAAGLVSLLLYAMLLAQPLSGLANVYGQVMLTRGAAERLLEFFGVHPEPIDRGGAALRVDRGRVEFQNVSFAYPGREAVLTDFSLVVEPGETVALTGPNGAGKTTLVHLLLRFITPGEGRILIDGQDIAKADLASLRRAVGLVSQQTLLLNGTVAENIRYGRPEAPDPEMKKAARAACADEFIQSLPDGYETVIGDQGVKLSGGQRQRLSLARTLLRDPPILVLDEATAMFDSEGEADFLNESRDLLKRKTVFLITHRDAILRMADRVIPVNRPAGEQPNRDRAPSCRANP